MMGVIIVIILLVLLMILVSKMTKKYTHLCYNTILMSDIRDSYMVEKRANKSDNARKNLFLNVFPKGGGCQQITLSYICLLYLYVDNRNKNQLSRAIN